MGRSLGANFETDIIRELTQIRQKGIEKYGLRSARADTLLAIANAVMPEKKHQTVQSAIQPLLELAIARIPYKHRKAAINLFLDSGSLNHRREKAARHYQLENGQRIHPETFRTGEKYEKAIMEELAGALELIASGGHPFTASPSNDDSEDLIVHRPAYEMFYRGISFNERKLLGLYGEPGTGKSVLARLLAKTILLDSDKPIHLNAKSEGTLSRTVAESLSTLFRSDGTSNVAFTFARWLSGELADCRPPKAVIIDNLSSWETVQQILPRDLPSGLETSVIIVSNRMLLPAKLGQSLLVGDMTCAEAKRMISLRLPALVDDSMPLASALDCRPLAIEHACGLLTKFGDNYSVKELLEDLRENLVQVLHSAPTENKLTGLYQLLIDKIAEDPHLTLAWRLFRLYVFLAPSTITDVTANAWALTEPSQYSPAPAKVLRSPSYNEAINSLEKFALLKRGTSWCHEYLVMHSLTHAIIYGLCAKEDEAMWTLVRHAAMQTLRNDDWQGGRPLSHDLLHWAPVISNNLSFGKCSSQDKIYDQKYDVFLLHAYGLRSERQMGEITPDGLKHYLDIYSGSKTRGQGHEEEINPARRPLALELISSSTLRDKDLSAKLRSQIMRDVPDFYLYDPLAGTPWYPIRTLGSDDGNQMTAQDAEKHAENEADSLSSARWRLLSGTIHYDHGQFVAADDAYALAYRTAIVDDSLAGYDLAFQTACRAAELHIRTASTEDAERWNERLNNIQTNKLWLDAHRYDESCLNRLRQIRADMRAARLYSEPIFLDHEAKAEANDLIAEYHDLIACYPRSGLMALIPYAEYQLGRLYVFLGLPQHAETRFMNAQLNSTRHAFGTGFGTALAKAGFIKSKIFRFAQARLRHPEKVDRQLVRTMQIAELIATEYDSPYWYADTLLTSLVLIQLYGDRGLYDADNVRYRAESAFNSVGRPDRLNCLQHFSPDAPAPVWLLAD